MSETAALPGYDIPAVEAWIAAHVPSLTPPLQFPTFGE